MAILKVDGFDHYPENVEVGTAFANGASVRALATSGLSSKAVLRPLAAAALSPGPTGQPSKGLRGINGTAAVGQNATIGSLLYPISWNGASNPAGTYFITAFKMRHNTINLSGLVAVASETGSMGVNLVLLATGFLVLRSSIAVTLATSSVPQSAGIIYSMEIKWTGSGVTATAVEVRQNGVVILSWAGSQATSNGTTLTDFVLGSAPNGVNASFTPINTDFDDFYIISQNGVAPNDYLGPGRQVSTFQADALTTPATTYTSAGAPTGFANLQTEDGDTGYHTGASVGERLRVSSTGVWTQLPASIDAVVVESVGRKVGAGARSVVHEVVVGGTAFSGGALAQSELYSREATRFPLNPATGLPWTRQAVEDLEFGERITV